MFVKYDIINLIFRGELFMNISAFLVTLFSGLSFFIGYLITRIVKDEKKLIIFAVGFAFSIIIGLCMFDMLEEALEMNNILLMLVCMIGGVIILKILDLFVPEHEHHHSGSHHADHIEHIGVISALALFLHNMIEGTAIYTTSLSDIKVGLFMALGVSCHNIPFGIQTSSLVRNRKERFNLLTILALSSIVGVLFISIFNISISELVSQILISIAFGMLIYIAFFELLCEVKEHIKKKELIFGLISGIIVILLGHLIG